MQVNRVGIAGRIAAVLAVVGVSNILADDGPPGNGGGGGSTNEAPATNSIVSFPLNLLSTCLQSDAPGNLSSLADLDAAVAAEYDQLTNTWMGFYPPGINSIPWDGGLFTFSDNGEIAANINLFQPTTAMGVSLWLCGVTETQLSARSWICLGASDGTQCRAFRTNAVPSFDPQDWVRHAYGEPPVYLSGSDLAQWFAARDRNRILLGITLIRASDLSTLQATQAAARASATNTAAANSQSPVMPADTNTLSFSTTWVSPGMFNTWIYTPATRPVAVLASTNLATATPWTIIQGSFNSTPLFNLWRAPIIGTALMSACGFIDQDSDGDGIPDFIEMKITHTDPYKWDSAGTSLGDYARFYRYGLSATNGDANADGMQDDEAILAGFDPHGSGTAPDPDASRYYYDADDRVAGAFFGVPAGAASYNISPAGNHASTAERSAP